MKKVNIIKINFLRINFVSYKCFIRYGMGNINLVFYINYFLVIYIIVFIWKKVDLIDFKLFRKKIL